MRCSLEKWKFRSEVLKSQELGFCSILSCKSQRPGHLLALLELCLYSAAIPEGPCWLTLSLEFCFVACHRRCQAAKASPTERFPKPPRNLKRRDRRASLLSVFSSGRISCSICPTYALQSSSGGRVGCPFHQETFLYVYPKFPLLLFMLTAVFPSPVREGEKLLYILVLYLEHTAKTNYQLIFQPYF